MSDPIQRSITNARMSQVIAVNGIVYLAGQISDIKHVPVKEQPSEILARIDTLLTSAGADRTACLPLTSGSATSVILTNLTLCGMRGFRKGVHPHGHVFKPSSWCPATTSKWP